MAESYSTVLDKVDNYVVIDTETTGFNADRHELIEVAAAKVENGAVVDTYQTLVKPSASISAEITGITGITDEMVAEAPSAGEAVQALLDFIGDLPIVGHNVTFDARFISAASGKRLDNDFIDTMRVARQTADTDDSKLGTVYDCCVDNGMEPVNDGGSAHRAMHDVLMTQAVYEHMKDGIGKPRVRSERRRSDRAAETGETPSAPVDEKKKFPTWAKVVIVIAILCVIGKLLN